MLVTDPGQHVRHLHSTSGPLQIHPLRCQYVCFRWKPGPPSVGVAGQAIDRCGVVSVDVTIEPEPNPVHDTGRRCQRIHNINKSRSSLGGGGCDEGEDVGRVDWTGGRGSRLTPGIAIVTDISCLAISRWRSITTLFSPPCAFNASSSPI